MKIAVTIFTIFLLGLNLLPCNDVAAENACGDEVHFHGSNNQENDADADHCSPFCQCFCCHIQIDTPQAINLTSEFIFLLVKRVSYYDTAGDEFINSLLRPPQAYIAL